MNRPEFEALALEHLDAVYKVCMQLTRNPEEAQDLLQDVYVRALRPSAVERFEDRSKDGTGGMRSWLFTIAHHTFYSKIKRAKLAPIAIGEFFDQASKEGPPDEPPPAWDLASLDWEQVDEGLKKAIEELRPEFRQVLLMWGVEGLKYRQIGEILEVPIGTVMSRLHRARKILVDQLGGADGIGEPFVRRDGLDGASGE